MTGAITTSKNIYYPWGVTTADFPIEIEEYI